MGKKRGKGCVTNDLKSVSPSERVKSYRTEPFTVSNKKPFCSGCQEGDQRGPGFLQCNELAPATTGKLLKIIDEAPACRKLKMELAITVNAMEPFVKATYVLEGDGPLALLAYQKLSALYNHISSQH